MTRVASAPAVAWSWPAAARGLTYVLPAGVVALSDPKAGAGLAIGVIPAAVIALPALRRQRVRIAVLGALVGLSLFVGGVLAVWPALAVVGLFALAVGAALLASASPLGAVALSLCVPVVAVGFSYAGFDGLGKAALLALGGVYAWLLSLPWPESTPQARPAALPPRPAMLEYGVRLGLTGAVCACVGFALDFDHVGWAAAAALLVMRPDTDVQQIRMVGRIGSVLTGSLVAVALIGLDAPDAVLAAAIVVSIVAATATTASRWYLTSTFTTFLVFLLLALGDVDAAESRFWERAGETLFGVGVAAVFGVLVPRLRARRHAAGGAPMAPE